MPKKLSLRARAALMYFVNSDMTISADRLAEEVAEGRDAIQTALKELRDAGFLLTRKERIGNRVVTTSHITHKGFVEAASWGLKIPLQIQYSELNNPIELLTNSSNNHNKTTGAVRLWEENVGYEFFEGTSSSDSELAQERDRAAKERRKQYEEDKARAHQKKMDDRAAAAPKDLSTNHTVALFVDTINTTWGLAPWRISGSRFLIALNKARLQYGTTGVIEEEMVKIFFTQLKVNKETDSNKLWMLFIKNFSALASQATVRIQTPDKLETAKQQSEDSWKGM